MRRQTTATRCAAFVAATAVALITIGIAAPANAATPALSIVLTETDGTAPFTPDDGAGLDASPNNAIVRVNDTITYSVSLSTDAATTGTSFVVVLPKGQSISTLPAFCITGSSVTPATLPVPQVPLTSNSYGSLPQQTVTCVIAPRTANSASTFPITVSVRPEVPNGVRMGPVSASVTADGVGEPVLSNSVSTTASALLNWDVSKNGEGPTANTGPVGGTQVVPCAQDPAGGCVQYNFPLTIASPSAGGKGTAPATSPITLTDNLDPAALFPGLTAAQLLLVKADLARFGATLACNADQFASLPVGNGGGNSQINVRNFGPLTCDQPGGPGTAVSLTLTDTDTSLVTYPTLNLDYTAIPAGPAYIVSKSIGVLVPVAFISAFGTPSGGISTIQYTNTFSDFTATGLDGAVEHSADQPTFNDSRSGTFASAIPSSGKIGLDKTFAGEPGAARNTGGKGGGFYIGGNVISGPPGGWGAHSGQIQVGEGQTVTSVISVGNYGSVNTVTGSAVACDVWDSTKLQLQSKSYLSDYPHFQQNLAAGRNTPVWLSGYETGGVWATPDNASSLALPQYTVEYSAGAFGSGISSTCGTGTWVADPAQVTGNDPALIRQGIYTAVNRVRIWTTLPAPAANRAGQIVSFSVGMRVAQGLAAGTVLPNFAAYIASDNAVVPKEAMLAAARAGTMDWNGSTYTAGTGSTDGNTGRYGDRLISAPFYARLAKLVKGPGQSTFGTTPPAATAGDTVRYQLSPTLNSTAPVSALTTDVRVEDCIPDGQKYTSSSVTPSSISVNSTPAAATIAPCAPGFTYIAWDLGQHAANEAIDPIIVTVTVSSALVSGTYTNEALVTAVGDASSADLRSASAQIQVQNPSEIALDKVALTPIIQVNRAGQAVNQLASWEITLLNNGAQGVLTDPDVIDILPTNGARGTAYHGTLAFTGANVVTGGASVEYTSSDTPDRDPAHASNGTNGSTTWCSAPASGSPISGTGSCPVSAAEVTALRVVRPGTFASGDVIKVQVDMTAIGDAADDVFVNSSFARVAGQSLPVGPVTAAVAVVSSSVGDLVWLDTPGDGIQHSNSAGVASFPVALSGTDDLGNTVTESTTTDAHGIYAFPGLRAGTYSVTFAASGLARDQHFSVQNAGTDAALDSNGDPKTGVAAPFTLASNTADRTIDQGIVTGVSPTPVPTPTPPVPTPVPTPPTPTPTPPTPPTPTTPTPVVPAAPGPQLPITPLLAFTGGVVSPLVIGGAVFALLIGVTLLIGARRRRRGTDSRD